MPNILLIGETGAGKTTAAVSRIMVPHFEEKICDLGALDPDHDVPNCPNCDPGGILVTNVELKREAWVERFGEEAVSERLVILPAKKDDGSYSFGTFSDFSDHLELRDRKGRGPMFVIDEAHKPLPAGMRFPVDKQTGQRVPCFANDILLLFTDQRHYLINLVMITQKPFTMAAALREQCHSTIALFNAESKGSARRYQVKLWDGPPPRNWENPKAVPDDQEKIPMQYDGEAQKLFVSNSKSKAAPSIGRSVEGRYKHTRSIWKRPIVMAVPVLIFVALMLGMNLTSIGSKEAVAHVVETETAQSKPSVKGKAHFAAQTVASGSQSPANDEPVISDLRTVEQSTAVLEARRTEIAASTNLYSVRARIQGRPGEGPVVEIRYVEKPEQVLYAFLSEYASFWGYAITAQHCGWTLTRSDNVRNLYDNKCLGVSHATPTSSVPSSYQAALEVAGASGASAARAVSAGAVPSTALR